MPSELERFNERMQAFFAPLWPGEEKPLVLGEGCSERPPVMLIGEYSTSRAAGREKHHRGVSRAGADGACSGGQAGGGFPAVRAVSSGVDYL